MLRSMRNSWTSCFKPEAGGDAQILALLRPRRNEFHSQENVFGYKRTCHHQTQHRTHSWSGVGIEMAVALREASWLLAGGLGHRHG